MRLKTKFQDEDFKLGETVDAYVNYGAGDSIKLTAKGSKGGSNTFYYDSIKDFTDHWEDAPEEPKEYWRITDLGELKSIRLDQHHQNIEKCKQIGNYFSSREEAEKALEKLKALTRLSKCGFKFKSWRSVDLGADKYYFVITAESDGAGKGDLDLLFGGEE